MHLTVVVVVVSVVLAFGFESNDIFPTKSTSKIPVYWNIPTFQCDTWKLNFSSLVEKFNIKQNDNDRFRGKNIAILYDPGSFPAILTQGTKVILRNGGVPQEGNLSMHLKMIEDDINELIPDEKFQGVGVLDFESWRPIFRQNFGSLEPYKNLSFSIERKKHPFWPQSWIDTESKKRFEYSGRRFMEDTLALVKKLRPKASWGYYAYPYCFNMNSNKQPECPANVVLENNNIKWLFESQDNFYPSIYMGDLHMSAKDKVQMITGRMVEANRVRNMVKNRKHPKILPYYWYKYHDTNGFLSKDDVFNTLAVLGSSNIDGLILWGSSNDVNTKKKCYALYDYIQDTLGPSLINNLM
ncbi:unnamed protein product [Brassicogethes aeneus]|uniref:Hyaluronidase n=1 Tax=Brassicogethes aeneus TaxID=1431903 RepID=A0A9P0FD73_BRAAE|nr:unnamed protein product [Brassicogethes aeneus]